ncbi:MAG: hypothetical protein LRS48_02005 [Desulfurococcales archaeon]|nr:hypothetical protein [Desulfurococcales archaeon]
MYAGTGNLSKTTIIEQLIYMSRELDSLVSTILRTLGNEGSLPEPLVLDKIYRQDVQLSKGRIDQASARILEFIASGRMGLIDTKEFYISVTMRFVKIMDYVSAAAHRMLLASKKLGEQSAKYSQINNNLRRLLKTLEDSLFEISSIVRGLTSIVRGNIEILKSLESKADRVKLLEEEADELYRASLEEILDLAESFKAYALYREMLDKLEDAIDEAERIATDLKILALSTAYG